MLVQNQGAPLNAAPLPAGQRHRPRPARLAAAGGLRWDAGVFPTQRRGGAAAGWTHGAIEGERAVTRLNPDRFPISIAKVRRRNKWGRRWDGGNGEALQGKWVR